MPCMLYTYNCFFALQQNHGFSRFRCVTIHFIHYVSQSKVFICTFSSNCNTRLMMCSHNFFDGSFRRTCNWNYWSKIISIVVVLSGLIHHLRSLSSCYFINTRLPHVDCCAHDASISWVMMINMFLPDVQTKPIKRATIRSKGLVSQWW